MSALAWMTLIVNPRSGHGRAGGLLRGVLAGLRRGASETQIEVWESTSFDHARVLISFADGATGLAEASRFARYGYDIRGEVEGSLGEVEIFGAETLPYIVRTETTARSEVTPLLRDDWFWNRFRGAFERELDTFIDAVRGMAQPAATLDDGLAALRIGTAAIRSVEEGRPILLEELP